MATFTNTIGTTNKDFTIGKRGLTLYPSTTNPVGSGSVKGGDFWFDLNEKSLRFRTTENDAWILPALDDIRITGNAILSGARFQRRTPTGEFVTQAEVTQDLVLYASGAGAILVDNDTTTPKIETPSDKNLLIHAGDTANGIGGDLVLAAGQALGTGVRGSVVISSLKWPNQDGTNGQVLTTDGNGQLSWSTVSAGGGDPLSLNDLIDVSTVGARANDILKYDGVGWVPGPPATGSITKVEDDPSPRLGGDLDVNGRLIRDMSFNHTIGLRAAKIDIRPLASSAQSEIILTPTATSGTLAYSSIEFQSADATSSGYLRFAEEGVLTLPSTSSTARVNEELSDNQIAISNPQLFLLSLNKDLVMYSSSDDFNTADTALGSKDNVRIFTDAASGGDVFIQRLRYPKTDGTAGQVLTTNGLGTLSWSTPTGGSSSLADLTDVQITSPSPNNVLKWTGSFWSNQQLVKSDITDADWISNVAEDATPQLGGNLDVNGYQLVDTSGSGVVLNGIRYPNNDGIAGEVLTTDGNGVASFQPLPTALDTKYTPVTADQTLAAGERYMILSGVVVTLPDYSLLSIGDNVRIVKKADVTPTIQASPTQLVLLENGSTVGTISYNKGREMLFVYDGTTWSLMV